MSAVKIKITPPARKKIVKRVGVIKNIRKIHMNRFINIFLSHEK